MKRWNALRILAAGLFLGAVVAPSANAAGKLFAAWSFDEGAGAKAKDGTGNGNDGTVSGAKWVDGKYGKALDFNGDGDHVLVPYHERQNVTKVSLTAWVFPKGWNPDLNAIAQKWEDGSNRRQYQLTIYQQKHWWYTSTNGSDFPRTDKAAIVIKDNEWTFLAGTYDGKVMKSYVNGTFDAELAQAAGVFASDIPIILGGYGPKTPVVYGQNRHFKGVIDEIRFYDDALTDAEIKEAMNTSLASFLAVDANGKLASHWGLLKRQ